MTGIVDPTKAGKYPVVLSDALLGKDPKEIYTGVRYNHKPSLSSATAPAQARIKPSSKKAPQSYDLSFRDDGGRYQYKGTRGVEENQYVMIFDAAREVFVIHKVDSMFNMNLIQTPSNDSAASLKQEFPHLESHSSSAKPTSKQSAKAKTEDKKTTAKPRKAAPNSKAQEKPSVPVPDKKPPPKPAAAAKKQRSAPAEEEEESSDDDLGLTIENPGGSAPSVSRDFSPNLFGIRPFSELLQRKEEEEQDEDADGEEDDEDDEFFTLPSPINRPMPEKSAPQQTAQPDNEEEEEDEEMEDVPQEQPPDDDALEAELLAELEDEQESDVSEEE
ncbi:RNA polymerase II transcription elongation factor-domain-containing protein [Hypoxylon sp. FL1284]|nr:RNA polymerase II transcription elongation factor-domain-containing protein [Hypoxylon sp. FL1284]